MNINKLLTIALIALSTSSATFAMKQEPKTLIELMPRELQKELMEYFLEAPGKDNIEKMINVANNIREFIKDKNIGPILEELARKYPKFKDKSDQILAAAVLATPNAIKWLSEQPEKNKWFVATMGISRFAIPGILPYVIAAEPLRNVHDENNGTLLHFAAGQGNLDAIKMLIGAGANINARDNNGNTPLLYVLYRPEIARYLIEQGADVMNIDLSQLREKDNNRSVEQVIIKARDEQSKKANP